MQHVGKVLGAGAYQYTLEVDGMAVTLLRDHVLTFAQNEFRHIQSTLDHAGEAITPVMIQAMRHILDQASASSKLETDYDTGKKQSELMHSQYEGLTVRAGDYTIDFTSVDWIDHGVSIVDDDDIRAYKVESLAPGTPFNRFINTSQADQLKALATALHLTETMMMLSGKHFDHDRHGDNFNVDRTPDGLLVTHYDPHAVNLEVPTVQGKKELGHMLATALQSVIKGEGNMHSVLLSQLVEHLGKAHHENNYLSALLRGLLAQGDYLRYLTPEDVQASETAVFASGTIDNVILASFMDTLMQEESGHVSQLMSFLRREPARVKIQSLPKTLQP